MLFRSDGRQRAALPGETGQIAVTDLHNYGMPFIRYLNDDLAVLGPTSRCGCGRTLSRLSAIEGRIADTLRDASGTPVGGLVFNLIFVPLAHAVKQFQVVQHADRSMTIRLVPGEGYDASAEKMLRAHCDRYFAGLNIQIDLVPTIPLAKSGKHRPVVVER